MERTLSDRPVLSGALIVLAVLVVLCVLASGFCGAGRGRPPRYCSGDQSIAATCHLCHLGAMKIRGSAGGGRRQPSLHARRGTLRGGFEPPRFAEVVGQVFER